MKTVKLSPPITKHLNRQRLVAVIDALLSTYHDFNVCRRGIERYEVTCSPMAWKYIEEVERAKTN